MQPKLSTHRFRSLIFASLATILTIAACSSPAATATPAQNATTAPIATTAPATGMPTKAAGTSATPTATIAGSASTNSCPTKGVTQLTAGGATFPFPLYSKMFDEYNKLCKVQVNYQSIGSGGGIAGLQNKTFDFAGSDAIMTSTQRTQAKGGDVLHIPTVSGAEAIIFNVPGVKRGEIKLTGEVLAQIYLKQITQWNDPKIKDLNPTVTLPSTDIAVVHRSDGSGTTFIFTNYLAKVSPEWGTKVGSATSVNWPGDIGGQGNEGVANQVKQIPGAIGYVELAYAKQNNLTWAMMRNKAGTYTDPTLERTTAAADVADLPANMEAMITDSANPAAYPIAGFTWLLIYQNQTDPAKANAIAHLAWWMTHEGQRFAPDLDYAPLKGSSVTKDEALIKKILVNGQPALP